MVLQVTSILAYIDPGAGSILLQLLIGAVVGAGLFLRHSLVQGYYRFTGLFKTSARKPSGDANTES